MLTPRFKLSQDERFVFITVHAPYTNIAETEVDIDGENFLFVSSPYFLRLQLPGKIIEGDKAKVEYVSDEGDFKMVFEKETPGEYFENLDMITSLLAPRDIPDVNPTLIEALEEDGVVTIDDNHDNVIDTGVNSKCYAFGFANRVTTEFTKIGNEFPQIFELKVPEEVALDDRLEYKTQYENEKFSLDHYLADYFDRELIEPYLAVTVYWEASDFNNDVDFTDNEVLILKELPNKNYLLTTTEHKQVMLGMIDILFGYCYDKRTTINETTVESGWTINKLSSTFSWFCSFNDLKGVLISCYRRALIFPIFRNFELCEKVKNDLTSLLRKGKRMIVKCFIEIYQIFHSNNDARYILNQLYVKDYLVFLQKCKNEEIEDLCKNLAHIKINKTDLDLELEELEYAAKLVQDEEESGIVENEMALKMASMSLMSDLKAPSKILEYDDDDSDSSSSDSSSSDSSSVETSSGDLDSDDESS